MSKKIISIIRPFNVNQETYIYDNGIKVKQLSIPLTGFNQSIFELVKTEEISRIDLLGSRPFLQGLKNQLHEFEQTKYKTSNLEVNII